MSTLSREPGQTSFSPSENPAPTQARLNINVNSQTARALEDHAATWGVSMTEAVRRLIGIGDFISREVSAGKDILESDQSGKTSRIVFKY